MKQLLIVATLAMALAANAAGKIGTVDMLKLVRNHSSYDPNKTLLTETQKDYQKKIDRMKDEIDSLQEEGKKLTEQARNSMLSAAAKAKIEKNLEDVQTKYITAQQRFRSEAMRSEQELADLEQRLLKATTEDLQGKLKAFAEKEGYDLIVNVTACPYASPSMDVTVAVLKEMGVEGDKIKEFGDEGK
ncbi:MAG: OmpH family outer membrane protein [Kiritimatiellae bacterium]|nr:OmpH family outer membrane protein [Kiritimatiellia bacterium]